MGRLSKTRFSISLSTATGVGDSQNGAETRQIHGFPVDIRCTLKKGEEVLTETWTYPLEPSLSNIAEGGEQPGQLAGRPLDEWNAAYAKVESYFHALRVRNKILLNRLVRIHVLKRAMRRGTPRTRPFRFRIGGGGNGPCRHRMVRGRIAAARHWHRPDAFHARTARATPGRHARQVAGPVSAARAVAAGVPRRHAQNLSSSRPGFSTFQNATARPLDLGPITTLTNFSSRLPFYRKMMVFTWVLFGIILVMIFVIRPISHD